MVLRLKNERVTHTHPSPVRSLFPIPVRARLKVGITDGFVRVSCGVENTEDLVSALKKGLDDL